MEVALHVHNGPAYILYNIILSVLFTILAEPSKSAITEHCQSIYIIIIFHLYIHICYI